MERVEPWREAIESAHADIQIAMCIVERNPEGMSEAAATALVAALGRLYDAVDGRAELVASVQVAANALGVVAETIDSEGALRGAVEAAQRAARRLSEAGERLTRAAPPARQPAESKLPLASLDRPRLHRVVRASLVPTLRGGETAKPNTEAAPVIARPRSFEELDALAENIAAQVRGHLARVLPAEEAKPPSQPAPKTRDDGIFIGKWARECLEEIGMAGLHRRPLLGDDWRAMRAFEQRMFGALDAFVSLGAPALAHLEGFVLDAPLVEPTRMFASAFVAGCLEGRDALGLAERLARDAAPNEELLAAVVAAFKLAPHPTLPLALRTLARDSDPALRALAVEVLAHRELSLGETLGDDELMTFVEDRPEVARHALLPLSVRNHPDTDGLLARALNAPRTREAAWSALFTKAPARAAPLLRSALDDSERAELLLALVGEADDAARLRERALREPRPWRAEALGWAGRVQAVPALIELLLQPDIEVSLAAARALDRLTGAGFVGSVAIPPEQTVPRELPEPPVEQEAAAPPLAHLTSDPRFAPSEGSPDRIEGPAIEPDAWRRWWKENASRFDAKRRYRRGAVHAREGCLAELDGPDATPAERQLLHLELAGWSRRYVHFDVDDLVVVQEEALAKWRTLLS